MPSWNPQANEIFAQALECATANERTSFLNDACASDGALRQDVEQLLAAHERAGDFLQQPAVDDDFTVDDPPRIGEGPGTWIGGYRLLEQIGEGGMGVVFMAEQERPVRRRVALKIIKPGMDTREVIARFQAEQQALALMDHPSIAKVFDAGITESGRPYFVMELVQGVPITDYCDQCHLTTRDRLALFVNVCQAIQHAHQKGVIHRDIKPTNVLVAIQDGEPAPKIIDFGVAKALNQRLTEHTLATGFAQMIGTPLYMSPEQAELSPLGADTRSDIYSLGVLLYELLTGTTPFDKERLHSASYDELRRIICEEEPPHPSARFISLTGTSEPSRTDPDSISQRETAAESETADPATTIAEHRRTDPRRLVQTIRGELDWIVMTCLEKDRNRRYETASDLAADIGCYLRDEPVAASPPSTAYRLRKFVRRNYGALTTAAAVLVTVLLGLATSTILIAQQRNAARAAAERERLAAQLADAERKRAEVNFRAARDAVDRLFTKEAEQMADQPHMAQIRRTLLEDALEFYEQFLEQKGEDPSVRHEAARAAWRVGTIAELLGRPEQAERALRRATEQLQVLSRNSPSRREYRDDLVKSRMALAYRFQMTRQDENWIAERRTLLDVAEQCVADFPTIPSYRHQLASAHTDLGNALKESRPSEAEHHFRRALQILDESRADFPNVPDDRFGRSHCHLWLGVLLLDTSRLDEAEVDLRKTVQLREQLAAEQPENLNRKTDLTHSQLRLIGVLLKVNKFGEAESLAKKIIAVHEELVDSFPGIFSYRHRLHEAYELLSESLRLAGRTQEAEDALRRAILIDEQIAEIWPDANRHPTHIGWHHYNLGLLVYDSGRVEEAADLFRQAQAVFEDAAAKHPDKPLLVHALAWFLTDCPATQFRDPKRAVGYAQTALKHSPTSARYWFTLAAAQFRAGEYSNANAALNKSIELANGRDARHWLLQAMTRFNLGDRDLAHKRYRQAVEWMAKHKPADEELRRFRAEAAQLLGFEQPPVAAPQSARDGDNRRNEPQPNEGTDKPK
jgi:serine/threonine protein kinase/tetratricopeptide (TPR) repeat protein